MAWLLYSDACVDLLNMCFIQIFVCKKHIYLCRNYVFLKLINDLTTQHDKGYMYACISVDKLTEFA